MLRSLFSNQPVEERALALVGLCGLGKRRRR